MNEPGVDRRTALRLAGISLVAVGCQATSTGRPGEDPGPLGATDRPSSSPSPSPTPTPPGLPAVARYQPLPGEPVPNGKQVAADVVQMLMTRARGMQPVDVVAATAALLAPGLSVEQLAQVAAPLLTEPVSTGEIVYPQLGGLVPLTPGAQQASVMVVARQRLLTADGTEAQVVRTMDVRIQVVQGQWRVTELASVGGEPVPRPAELDRRAVAVLDDARIELPDTCRWDIHAGRISLDVLSVLAAAAAVSPLSVTVLATGHPTNVFGTSKLSNHTQGRAVDVWRIGGQPVVSTGAAAGPAGNVLRTAAGNQLTRQTGSPDGSDLDGPARRSFTDLVHKDHLHLAVGASASR